MTSLYWFYGRALRPTLLLLLLMVVIGCAERDTSDWFASSENTIDTH